MTDTSPILSSDIAIISAVGVFPGAPSVEAYWQNIQLGIESISHFSPEELLAAGISQATVNNPHYVPARGIVEGIEYFDAPFFGYSPREAELIDPQQRVFMEQAWHALEAAGYSTHSSDYKIGIFCGSSTNTYLLTQIVGSMAHSGGLLETAIANDKDHMATRVAYKLNLTGPALNIQTTCSTSLVAACMAVQALTSGHCDMALAGGVSLGVPVKRGYTHHAGGIHSSDGHVRSFDADASGTVFSSGSGIVVLKRLEDAVKDRDTVIAVIKGWAVNNDGSQKVGYTAPSIDGQAEVVRRAQAEAGVSPSQIGYVEAHGTGTSLGDPIEMAGLAKAFGDDVPRQSCAVGSVKSNIGHLNSASGIASLIKAALVIRDGVIPPSLHYKRPNPQINIEATPFYVSTTLAPWPKEQPHRYAGVSAYGIGGTNAHIILAEPPVRAPSSTHREHSILTLSAKSEGALDESVTRLRDFLIAHPKISLADAAYTLHLGRFPFRYRASVTCDTVDGAVSILGQGLPNEKTGSKKPSVALMFPGQGVLTPGVTRLLHDQEPVFAAKISEVSQLFEPHIGCSLESVWYGEASSSLEARLMTPSFAQPCICALEYAMAKTLAAWGVRPSAMIGHSIGEYVAACLAGVFSLESAVSIIAVRGRLMDTIPGGAMVAISADPDLALRIAAECGVRADLAAVNDIAACVLSVDKESVTPLVKKLSSAGIESHVLKTSHSFHSHMLDPILGQFSEEVGKHMLNVPQIPFISNVTGTWMTDEDATDPTYWSRHMRQGVLFHEGLTNILESSADILLECGPGQVLTRLARHHEALDDREVVPTMPHAREPQKETHTFSDSVGKLWRLGVDINWRAYHDSESLGRISLPGYAFERQRYWVEPGPAHQQVVKQKPVEPTRKPIDKSFYGLSWKRMVLEPAQTEPASVRRWIIFADKCGVAEALTGRLTSTGHNVVRVHASTGFEWVDEHNVLLNPASHDDYRRLIDELYTKEAIPDEIVHLWNVTEARPKYQEAERDAFNSLLYLVQAFGATGRIPRLKLSIVSNGLHDVIGDEDVWPERALLMGPRNVVPQEYEGISTKSIDIRLNSSTSTDGVGRQILSEIDAWSPEAFVALRGSHRWVRVCETVRLPAVPPAALPLRKRGVYVITGGLGGIALALADYLAQNWKARLVLVTRRPFPPQSEWATAPASHPDAAVLSKLTSLLAMGSEIEVVSADICDHEAISSALDAVRRRWGRVAGVIHSAGVSGGGIIELKNPEGARKVLAPKVQGLEVLVDATQSDKPDFIVLCSSTQAIRGGAGQVDYSAANAYLDSAACGGYGASPRIISINWGTWRESGMAVTTAVPEDMRAQREHSLHEGISHEEGVEAFLRILASPHRQVAVAPVGVDLQTTKVYTSSSAAAQPAATKKAKRKLHKRPNLDTPFVPPTTDLDIQIAAIWRGLLGIEEIGLHDNFFSLGGHSLMAVRLTFRIRSEFEVDFSLMDLFDAPTVAQIGEAILEKYASAIDPEELENMLREIQSLTADSPAVETGAVS